MLPDTLVMSRIGSDLVGYLPGQPPAGKLEYRVILRYDAQEIPLNEVPVVIRFKGEVPAMVLIPHILFIFAAQLLSLVAGIYAIYRLRILPQYLVRTTAIFDIHPSAPDDQAC